MDEYLTAAGMGWEKDVWHLSVRQVPRRPIVTGDVLIHTDVSGLGQSPAWMKVDC